MTAALMPKEGRCPSLDSPRVRHVAGVRAIGLRPPSHTPSGSVGRSRQRQGAFAAYPQSLRSLRYSTSP